MNPKFICICILLLTTTVLAQDCPQDESSPHWGNALELCHPGLTIYYDSNTRNLPLASFTIHTREQVQDLPGGRTNFHKDPLLPNGRTPSDPIYHDPMSRGHLTPSKIMSYNHSHWESTYLMSNILPQNTILNEHPWEQLEVEVIDILKNAEPGTSWGVYTGGFWNTTENVIPSHFWKAFCDWDACSSGVRIATNEPEPQWQTLTIHDFLNDWWENEIEFFSNCCPTQLGANLPLQLRFDESTPMQ